MTEEVAITSQERGRYPQAQAAMLIHEEEKSSNPIVATFSDDSNNNGISYTKYGVYDWSNYNDNNIQNSPSRKNLLSCACHLDCDSAFGKSGFVTSLKHLGKRIKEFEVISKAQKYELINNEVFRTKFIAMACGNIMEWYDYIMFGSLVDVIGDEFFPQTSPTLKLLESWSLFGVAFLVRPLGGVLIGWIGDTYSRKRALEISIGLMMVSTSCIAFLPSYHTFGWPMTLMILILRLMQGLSCGGETVGAFIYIIEATKGNNRGYWGACCKAQGIAGCSIAMLVVSVLRYSMTYEQLRSYGWRLAFIMGTLFGVMGIFFRKKLEEEDNSLPSHHTDDEAANGEAEPNQGEALDQYEAKGTSANSLVIFNGHYFYQKDESFELAVDKKMGGKTYSSIDEDGFPMGFPLSGNQSDKCDAGLVKQEIGGSKGHYSAITFSSSDPLINEMTDAAKVEVEDDADETIIDDPEKDVHNKSPERPKSEVTTMLYWREILLVFVICSFSGIAYYTYFVWMSFFMSNRDLIGNLKGERRHGEVALGRDGVEFSWIINCFMNIFLVILLPVGGKLGDLLGSLILSGMDPKTKRTDYKVHSSNNEGFRLALIIALVTAIILVIPSFFLIFKGTLLSVISGQIIFVFILSVYTGNLAALLNSLFDRRIKYFSVGLAYNVASAVFSGTAPLICTALVLSSQMGYIYTDDDAPLPPPHERSLLMHLLLDGRIRPAYYIIASAVASLIALVFGIPYCVQRRRNLELMRRQLKLACVDPSAGGHSGYSNRDEVKFPVALDSDLNAANRAYAEIVRQTLDSPTYHPLPHNLPQRSN